jgi:3-oxoacyl-[acyl-carrier protein] reductase
MKKNVMVTGCNGGLGLGIVRHLIQSKKYFVIGMGSKPNFNEELTEFITDGEMIYFPLDLSAPQDIQDFFLSKIKKIGPIYSLINNAAAAYDDLCSNADLTELENMFKVNTFSPIMLSKYAIRNMLLHETKGSIVHISSISAHTGYKGLSMYAASKGAIESFSRTVAREYGSRGIRSNCIVPGFMETGMSESLSKDQKQRIYNRTSLKSSTSLNSVALLVLTLLSDESESITGSTMHVDSGTI